MGSNVNTVHNQGGGSKKAGLPYQIGRGSWDSIYLHGTSQRLNTLNKTLVFTRNFNRNIDGSVRIRGR
jgi:hypothetical protein